SQMCIRARHLHRTLEALLRIRDRIGVIAVVPERFWVWAALAALLHDAGKLPVGFQRMIGNTAQPAAVWGERHEVLSLGFVELLLRGLPPSERLWVAAPVAGHHRAFTAEKEFRRTPLEIDYGSDEVTDFATKFLPADRCQFTHLCRWLRRVGHRYQLTDVANADDASLDDLIIAAHSLFNELLDRWEESTIHGAPGDGVTAVLLLGAVTMADHLSSAGAIALDTAHPLAPDYREQLEATLARRQHSLYSHQQRAAKHVGHILLRSPTASGKTETSLLWARTQITDLAASGTTARLFYILPYLASINAMADRFAHDLPAPDGIGVAHSKAASYHLSRALADGCPTDEDAYTAAQKARSRAHATKHFRELLRVGTPYQLLRGALAGPAHASILLDTANSVFVLDELHAFDAPRLGMILAMMRQWEDLGGRIAVLSATLPTVLENLVRDTLHHRVETIEPPTTFPWPARHRIHTRTAHLTDPASTGEISERIAAGESVLVVANNVRDAITLYETLAPECIERHGPDSAHLLHARFRRGDRSRIESNIMHRFRVGTPCQPGLLVGTQTVEVSLNIDLDRCHTSAADLQALLQRFGRANRIAAHKDPVPVVIHQPRWDIYRGGTHWADGVYERVPTEMAWNILQQHNGEIIDDLTATSWLNHIYDSPWGHTWKETVEAHQKQFREGFLEFARPFDDRSHLAAKFDEQFDGLEALLATDEPRYRHLLDQAPDHATGRLRADDLLIPLPHWARHATAYSPDLGIHIIPNNPEDYDPYKGLLSIRGRTDKDYRPGEII
ncbi:CRISPR-associated helicase Cas3', partial [Nocardia alni]|uniref:CRISPR-associated helicase Cas3' n=1 Tax=Nocardia alni TaxID=2815723 RepID=UPI001C250F9B